MKNPVLSIFLTALGLLFAGQSAMSQTNEYKQGLVADVYVEEAQTGKWSSKSPIGIAIATFIDKKAGEFSLGNIKADNKIAPLIKDHTIGVEWSGFLHVENPGEYVVIARMSKPGGDSFYANSCDFIVKLDNTNFLGFGFKWDRQDYYMNTDDFSKTKLIKANLDAGYHAFSLWHHCGVTSDRWNSWMKNYGAFMLKFQWKGPSDRVPQDIPSSAFVWK